MEPRKGLQFEEFMFTIIEALNKKELVDKLNKEVPAKVFNIQKVGPSWEALVLMQTEEKAPKEPTKTELAAKKAIELGVELKGNEKLKQIEKMIKDHEAESQADTNNEDEKVK